jgi:hypothetical protein
VENFHIYFRLILKKNRYLIAYGSFLFANACGIFPHKIYFFWQILEILKKTPNASYSLPFFMKKTNMDVDDVDFFSFFVDFFRMVFLAFLQKKNAQN